MTGTDIVLAFELYVDDSTELSTAEEFALLNKIYRKVLNNRAWEVLKKEWSTTTDGNAYLDLPDDFGYFTENVNFTDNSIGIDAAQSPKSILVNGVDYKIVNWSDRRSYDGSTGVCYVDARQERLYFSETPASGLTVSGDYIYRPDAITSTTSPVFPSEFHEILYHGMAVDDMIIQIFDKARSYADQNQAMYDSYIADMAFWNSQFINM